MSALARHPKRGAFRGSHEDVSLTKSHDLKSLGWSADFLRQLEIDEIGVLEPARVTAVHRDRLDAMTETGTACCTAAPPGSRRAISSSRRMSIPCSSPRR